MKRVLIIEAQIKQYRFVFYEQLKAALQRSDIDLQVGYSDPTPVEAAKRDNCNLPTDYGRKVKGYWFFGDKILFQPLLSSAVSADLVVVEQANRFVLNHLLIMLSRIGLKRVAFWGLGENLQAGQLYVSECYRRKTLNAVSWWFAYTKGTARYLIRNGVPSWKITSVDNAVDTSSIRRHVDSILPRDKAALRERLGITPIAPVGIFCGMLDKVKSVPFLLESAKLIRNQIPDFHLLLVGGGPEKALVEKAVKDTPWIHYMGPQFGDKKTALIALSDVFLIPGRVGLVVLDAFAGGLPLLSTRLKIHGPEMEYLEEGFNGLLSEPDVAAFANMTVSLLRNREALERLQQGARQSGSKYTIENMVANFKKGIECCLGLQSSSQRSLLKDGIA